MGSGGASWGGMSTRAVEGEDEGDGCGCRMDPGRGDWAEGRRRASSNRMTSPARGDSHHLVGRGATVRAGLLEIRRMSS